MKNLQNGFILPLIIGLISLLLISSSTYYYFTEKTNKQIICTKEMKKCSDGSYVGRSGVNCEFKSCPLIKIKPFTSELDARNIAEKTCVKGGEILSEGVYNSNTKTWWYDANLNTKREGCNPACVVNEETKTAEINWRCTGLKEPVACTSDAKQCPDGSYIGRSGTNCDFICPEIKNIQIIITDGLKEVYSMFKYGKISECVQNEKTYYTGGINAYDGGESTLDITGKIVGECNGLTGKCSGVTPTNCEIIYSTYPNVWGLSTTNKYNLK